jgi:hypothetical protein
LIGVVFIGNLSILAGLVLTIGARVGLQLDKISVANAETKIGFINFILGIF